MSIDSDIAEIKANVQWLVNVAKGMGFGTPRILPPDAPALPPIPPAPTPPAAPQGPVGAAIGPAAFYSWPEPGKRVSVMCTPGVSYPCVIQVPAGTRSLEFRFGPGSNGSDGHMDLWLTDPAGKVMDGPHLGVNHEHGDLRAGPDYGTTVYEGQWIAWVRSTDFTGEVITNFSHS